MGHSLFISDLHLCESRLEIMNDFVGFLTNTASHAENLYILGDLFEYWPGDDVIATGAFADVINGLQALANRGVNLFLIHGNRDFLLGEQFSELTKVRLLPDPHLVTLYDTAILLSHGDTLCTDDTDYQAFRATVRNDKWITDFLDQPLYARITYIESIRKKSEVEKSIKSMEIMDVNQYAVESLLKKFDYPPLFIHGHTHRPNRHQYLIDGHRCERCVLGDWYEHGSFLKLDTNGIHEHSL
ncbi:MAG: UDP-2,3-diacylglucosamine diphosphatase [Methylotenera sp.]|jgi:UDP-2,3-diacylglucosamine hydrolase